MFFYMFVFLISCSIAPESVYAQLSVETFDNFTRYPGSTANFLKADDNTTNIASLGKGLELGTCLDSTCVNALSGTRTARGRNFFEFNNEPITVNFEVSQQFVRVRVRSDKQYDPVRMIRAEIIARGPGFPPWLPPTVIVDRQEIFFRSDAGWQTLSVSVGFGVITAIEIVGGRTDLSSDDNFIAIDDLEFDRSPPISDDNTAPEVTINVPNPDAVENDRLVVETTVMDDSLLDFVVGSLFDANGLEIDTFEFCGVTLNTFSCSTSAPSSFEGQANADVTDADDGIYEVRVTARDFSGNEANESVVFSLTKFVSEPEPQPEVVVEAVEVTQGTSSGLDLDIPPPEVGIVHPYSPLGTIDALIEGRDTLVRFYAYSLGEEVEEYTARLAVTIRYADGSRLVREFVGNVDQRVSGDPLTTTTLPALSQVGNVFQDLVRRRNQPSEALNFMIPGVLLQGADTIDFQLRAVDVNGELPGSIGDLTGTIGVTLLDPIAIGVNAVRVDLGTGAPSETDIEEIVERDMKAVLPVTEAAVVSMRYLPVDPGGLDSKDLCYRVGWVVWAVYGSDAGRVTDFTDFANITPAVGFVRFGGLGGSISDPSTRGCGDDVGSADDDLFRRYGVVVAELAWDHVTHEIGHLVGIRHAGSDHGEDDAENWPFPHGHRGPSDVNVQLERKPNSEGFGVWRWPPANIWGQDATTHDFMSYGKPVRVSARNWNRFWLAVAQRIQPSSNAISAMSANTIENHSTVDALLVAGTVDQEDSGFLPFLRKRVPSELVDEPSNPDAVLELFDADGVLLQSNAVRISRFQDIADSSIRRLLVAVPYIEGVDRVRLSDNEGILLQEQASANAPKVKVLSPNGGEQLGGGTVDVSWEASDEDGDPLTFLVQYSPDGGASWQSIGLIPPGNPFETSFGAGELPASANAMIRVVASDGLRITEDHSDCPFSLRAGTPDACDVVIDVKPASCPNPLVLGSPGVIPVTILGSDRIDVSAISNLALAGVPARRTVLKDVGSEGACDEQIPDDVTDLVAHFDAKAVSEALGSVEPGEVVEVTLTGQMATASTSTSIVGTDIVTIVPPGQ